MSSRKRLTWRTLRDGFREPFLVGVQLLEHDHRQIDVVLLESEDRGGVVHQHVGVEHEEPPPVRGRAFGSAFAGSAPLEGRGIRETSPLQELPPRGPGTFTLRHSRRRTPSASIRNVLRSMPMYFLPYRLFSLMTSNSLHTFSSSSRQQLERQLLLRRELLVRLATLSRETPTIAHARLAERGVQVAEVLALARAARWSCPSDRSRCTSFSPAASSAPRARRR